MNELSTTKDDKVNKKRTYQVSLVDKSNRNIDPMDYPRTNKFFDTIEERNKFVGEFETSVTRKGGKLIQNHSLCHPLFLTFSILDKHENMTHELVVYL